ncbi:inter-alpha-trypsin inhibitor heavy chain H3 isoform X2 [Anarrhichthys ocellatus]|uniref:inter-alpha-trypsin inhibitor heavy chain H3 isoform X2 n=1 Tax=Anarrhichthys ocellatus TaxID=433405 RepID=UPI0012ED4C8F|nr:inter-alpha-trypsin inhibitor heavy chain H3-like isoform X2 [Anarrhichthys ocellatus]
MERAVVQITLFGLLLASATTLPNKDDWDIYSFHINSTVTSRYATTVITSRVANRVDDSKEVEFQVRIPKNAFISKFRMFIDGQVYDGVVKGKEKAQQQYTEAVSRGETAGLVSSVGRTLEEFKTSVTMAALKKVTFELTYEELLRRRLGKYDLQIHARPMQPVKDFKVDVYINEKAGINSIKVKGGLSTKALANAITKTHVDKQAWVYFYPTEDQQKMCDSCGEQGMNGDLVVVYDVNRNPSLGDIKKSDRYFVHHFAPSNLASIPKNVVFVIDQSGSMHGRKMQQTRIALIHILSDLAEDDHFGLITFDSSIFHWKRELVQANMENLESAKKFSREIVERGSTDINKAVLEGARMLNAHPREGSASMLILLTDGDPTSGVTNLEVIQSNVRGAIADKFPLYCLGFGFDVNFEFLEKMSLQSNGVARRIYEDSDADLQLKGFYEEVATPLLTDVTMIYNGGTNLTQTNFSQYYNGSEIVVAGQITDNNIETFTPQVVAISSNRRVRFSDTNATVESNGPVSDSHIQRVWAYLTVKQLLEKELVLSGPEKENAKKEAFELSLKYSFVTPLTSMVVTKPQGENTDVLHKPKEGEATEGRRQYQMGRQPMFNQNTQRITSGLTRQSYPMPAPPGIPARSVPGVFYSPVDTGLRRSHDPVTLPGVFYSPVDTADRDFQIGTVDYDSRILPSIVSPIATDVPLSHRFLLKTENLSLPLCFDVTGDVRLKLLHHPNRELSVNGELDSVENGGFRRIVIHLKNDLHVEIDPKEITVREGQTLTRHVGPDPITAGSLAAIRQDKEIDVAAGDTRMIIIIHEQNGEEFLWPVLRQRPLDNNVSGILALKPAVYEEVQQSPPTRLKIKDQEIDVTRASAVDYSTVSPPTHHCWLMSAESALQSHLDDFIILQL